MNVTGKPRQYREKTGNANSICKILLFRLYSPGIPSCD